MSRLIKCIQFSESTNLDINMIQITDKVNCCGCNACGDICPKQAITFKTDNEGFWYPEVDLQKCIDCHLCEKVCPIINVDSLKKNDFVEPLCYAAIHKNYEVRFDSTSGGLFSAFAEKFYHDKGYVGGAIYNEDWSVRQYISANKADLPKLRSSKYQQSSFEGFYRQVRDLVKQGEKILVCGSPCQMAALRAFLNYKDYENLLILDFVCRGTNSPMISRKFSDMLELKHHSKIVYRKAKNKELGWKNLTLKLTYANGDNEYLTKEVNPFTRGYLGTGVFCRPSCYECKFKGFPRIADITLADFWGIEKIDPTMFDNIGTSLVLINNEKGQRFFDAVAQKIKAVKLPYKTALAGNPSILQPLQVARIDRERFFKDAEKMDFNQLSEKYFPVREKNLSLKQRAKQVINVALDVWHYTPWYCLTPKLKFIYYNFFRKNIQANILNGGYFLPSSHTVVCISKKARVVLNSRFRFGTKRIKGSKLESRLLIEDGATVEINSRFGVLYGSDIEIFKGATFIVGSSDFVTIGGTNFNFTLIYGNKIEIGYHVMMGRNVTIRDNNGGHYLSMQGYKESRPIKIGNHVWLCEGCTIMPGANIGDGAIVGAGSVVYGHVPPYSLVSGNPAKVVQTNTYWKY